MHFRVRGNSVQIVRTEQDATKGKPVSRPVGSANLVTGALNPKLQAALSPQEIEEAKAWIAGYRRRLEQRRALEFDLLPDRLREATAGLRRGGVKPDAAMVQEITEGMRAPRLQLRRIGKAAKAG